MKKNMIAWAVAGLGVLAVAALVVFGLSQPKPSQAKFHTVCLDGVEYWTTNTGWPTTLAIKADPVTLAPVRCDQ
jgi:hypothetical protein